MNQKLYSKFHSEKVGDEVASFIHGSGELPAPCKTRMHTEKENRVELPLIPLIFQDYEDFPGASRILIVYRLGLCVFSYP